MSWTVKCTSTPIDPSIPFSILDLKAQAVRLPVSKGAQILLSELLTWSGERGYCWWGVSAIAKDLGWSTSVVWRRSAELKHAGLLAVIPRPGRSNFWIPLPGRAKMERLQDELTPLATSRGHSEKKIEKTQKRCTLHPGCTSTPSSPPSPNPTNDNVVKGLSSPQDDTDRAPIARPMPETSTDAPQPVPCTPTDREAPATRNRKSKAFLTPQQWLLVQDIETDCQDFHSRGHFINLVRRYSEESIYAALSVTKEKLALESGVNGGAFFYRTLQAMVGDMDRPSYQWEHQPAGPVWHNPAPPRFIELPTAPPPDPEPLDPETLKKGWRIRYRGGGLGAMLSLVDRCMPGSLDVTKLWTHIRETFSGVEEGVLVDRFLDTVVTRMRHAGRGGEACQDEYGG